MTIMMKNLIIQSLVIFPGILSIISANDSSSSSSPWHQSAAAAAEGHNNGTTSLFSESFVPFPEVMQPYLDSELELYKTKWHENLPVLRVFQEFPEPADTSRRIWPQAIQIIHKRLYPILWPRVHYYVMGGLDFGCRRKPDTDNPDDIISDGASATSHTEITLPITTSHCHRHCLHQGRYCLDEPDMDSGHRRAAIKEILRRLCMDTIYHAKDPRFILYLEYYDEMECFYGTTPSNEDGEEDLQTKPLGGFRNCSLMAMNLAGMKYSEISKCIAEDKYDKDIPNNAMENNLRQLVKRHHPKHNNYTLPYITINDNKLLPVKEDSRPLDAATIFLEYCSSFFSTSVELEPPLACRACMDCNNIQECLWTLKCNGTEFDPTRLVEQLEEVLTTTTTTTTTVPPTGGSTADDTEEPPVLPGPHINNMTDTNGIVDAAAPEIPKMEAPTVAEYDDDSKNYDDTNVVTEEMQEGPDSNKGKGGTLVVWILAGITALLVCISCIAVFSFTQFRREDATKFLLDLAEEAYTDGNSNCDDDADDASTRSQSTGYSLKTMDLEVSIYRGSSDDGINRRTTMRMSAYRDNKSKHNTTTTTTNKPEQEQEELENFLDEE